MTILIIRRITVVVFKEASLLAKILHKIRQIFVFASKVLSYKNYVTALITPNRRTLSELAFQLSKPHLTFDQQCEDSEIVKHIHESLKQTGRELDFNSKEIPRVITLVKEEWAQENDLLTAAMKMKRKQVNDFYKKQIEQMFEL